MKKTKRKLIVDSNDYSIERTKQTVFKVSREIGKSNRRTIVDGWKIAVDGDYFKSLNARFNIGKNVL